ncbi:MAG TPA: electron transport complex subunit G, partial [Pseudomonas sp.]|nr:electron transport complex subunit G [Pseudomonas sp.]
RSEPDEATVHSRAGSAATRDELRTTEPAAKPQGDQP